MRKLNEEERKDSANSLLEIKDLGDVGWTSLYQAFSFFQKLEKFAGGCTADVTDMSYMFNGSPKVTPDVSSWNTSNVTDMSYMFGEATSANPDVSNWNFSSIRETYTTDYGDGDVYTDYYIDYMFSPDNGLSTENYSTLLKKLAADPSARGLKDGVTGITLDVGAGVKYNADAQSARDHLVKEHSFEITDGGQAP